MAIIDTDTWQEWANRYVTGTELLSLASICTQVDQAIKTRLQRTIEQQTFTDLIFDAPTTPNILLTRYQPITIATDGAHPFKCWYNDKANGDPTAFDDTADLLTMYSDYVLNKGPDNPNLSPGILTRVAGVWGVNYLRRPFNVALQQVPIIGAVKLTFQGGYATIPQDLIEAACLAIAKILRMRRYGDTPSFEAWNGYSYTISTNMMNGILGSPQIVGLLDYYTNKSAIFG